MKVILLQDVEGLGKKYEVKEVKNGHARNLLLPEKLVRPATKEETEHGHIHGACDRIPGRLQGGMLSPSDRA